MQILDKVVRSVVLALLSLFPALCLAQAYGTAAYNSQSYGGPTVTLPFVGVLPATGAIASLIAMLAISTSVSLIVWASLRRRRRLAQENEDIETSESE
jgi:LPXTG-motif cell wall-anchored protein